MTNKRQIKVKVKKTRIKYKRIFLLLLLLGALVFSGYYIFNLKITNIYCIGNNIVGDNTIIKYSKLNDYPSFLLTSSKSIKNNLKKNAYIKSVTIKKKFFGKILLYVTENRPLFIYNNELVLDSGTSIDNIYNINNIPIVQNVNEEDKPFFDEEYNNLIKKMNIINSNILLKISEIKYSRTNVDNKRFLFIMNDGNSVYITLSKIDKINMYNEIIAEFGDKRGILYLDMGSYFEIKN